MPRLLQSPDASEASGLICAFVPVRATSETCAAATELSRILGGTLKVSALLADFRARGFPVLGTIPHAQGGALLVHGERFDTLEAHEVPPRQIPGLLNHARRLYEITSADLTGAQEIAAYEVLAHADSIFLVSGTDAGSLGLVKRKKAWLHSIGLSENTGLVLHRARLDASPSAFEDKAGLPVCGLIDSREGIQRLARWLAVCRPKAVPKHSPQFAENPLPADLAPVPCWIGSR
jgi:hypothetical protein